MSWGTYYQYNGYLSHIGKNEIDSKREECNSVNDMLWREILAYMAATPPAYAKDDEGNEYPWAGVHRNEAPRIPGGDRGERTACRPSG